jgi:hypothetical protein
MRSVAKLKQLAPALVVCCLIGRCQCQGTMMIGFEGAPYTGAPYPQAPGTYITISSYAESEMAFANPYGQENLVLVGSGASSLPDNGTAHLQVSTGAKLSFSLTPVLPFNLVSFDAAGYGLAFPSAALQVIGYKVQIMGPPVTVTNYFSVDSLSDRRANSLPDFQTFTLDSQFVNL